MTKDEVVRALEEISKLLQLADDNPFKARAYKNAARAIAGLDDDLATLDRSGRLRSVPGLGAATADKVETLLRTGSLPYLDELRASLPPGLLEIAALKGIGVKRARQLIDALDVHSLGELEHACTENRLLTLDGYGERSQAQVLEAIQSAQRRQKELRFDRALLAATPLLAAIRACPATGAAELAGAVRRRCEIVDRIEIVVATNDRETIATIVAASAGVAEIVECTPESIVARLHDGLPVAVHTTSARDYAATLFQSTGTSGHLSAIADRARRHGVTIEPGGARHSADGDQPRTEDELFAALGLPPIPPELREGLGEIEAADEGRLPSLIELADLRGVIHNHTNWSDGRNTLDEMVAGARALGWDYLGISDHSVSARYAHGLEPERVRAQHALIDATNASFDDSFRILKGAEVDILADGSLDYDADLRAGFDFAIASLHGRFDLPRKEQTQRVLRAVADPTVMVLGHPTGRLLSGRDGADLDLDAVIDACAEHGVAIEINASPHRLELDWRYLRRAKERGVKLFISPDAHRVSELQNVALGVGIARKGWLEADDVVNTRDLQGVLEFFAERRARG